MALFQEGWLLGENKAAGGGLHLLQAVFDDRERVGIRLDVGVEMRTERVGPPARERRKGNERQQQHDDKHEAD